MTLATWALAIAVLVIGGMMTMTLFRLRASVVGLTTVTASAVALLTNLAQEIRENAEDPEALDVLADDIDSNVAQLAAAVTANTASASESDALEVEPDGDAEGYTGESESGYGVTSGTEDLPDSSDTSSMTGGDFTGDANLDEVPVTGGDEPTGESDSGETEGGESGEEQPA